MQQFEQSERQKQSVQLQDSASESPSDKSNDALSDIATSGNETLDKSAETAKHNVGTKPGVENKPKKSLLAAFSTKKKEVKR